MKTIINFSTLLILAMFSSQAMAQIELKTIAEIEVTETDKQGKKIVKRTAPTTVVPGTEVIYTITAKNTGNEPADNIVVTNPVPKDTEYVDGSAFGAGTLAGHYRSAFEDYDEPERKRHLYRLWHREHGSSSYDGLSFE